MVFQIFLQAWKNGSSSFNDETLEQFDYQHKIAVSRYGIFIHSLQSQAWTYNTVIKIFFLKFIKISYMLTHIFGIKSIGSS